MIAAARREAATLDAAVAKTIAAWHRDGTGIPEADFSQLALAIFAYQLKWNAPYAAYCASLGVTPERLPQDWRSIPPVPAAAYKDATLATFPVQGAEAVFETSGTTLGRGGRHFMESLALYDAALLAGFDRFMLADGARLRYANLVPNPDANPHSSLGYMMGAVARARGTEGTGWFVDAGELREEAFFDFLRHAQSQGEPVCIATTAFALAAACEACNERGTTFALPNGSRIMETGGFKGRSHAVSREALYAAASRCFGIAESSIVAEYGMTELTSQYYDAPASRDSAVRVKVGPPWLRFRIAGPDGRDVPDGTVGALVHVDLANRSSCVAIVTEDLGVAVDGGLVLLGRDRSAELRGCSLDAEALLEAART